jgi:hypothetical protein
MKMLLAVSLTVLAVGLSASGQEHTKSRPRPSPAATPTAPVAPNSDDSGWETFTSETGRFSVLLPGTPAESKETEQSAHGPYTTYLYILRHPQNVFLIGWVDYSPSFNFNRQAELEMNRDNFVKGVNARLLNSRAVVIDGYNSLEFTAETADQIFKSRVYMVGRRPYQMVIGSPKGAEDTVTVNRFFNSFKVTP